MRLLRFIPAAGVATLIPALGALDIKLPEEKGRLLESPLPGYALAQGLGAVVS